jgi:uncharacterized protein YyaL (SSP411 family)
MTDHPTNRLSRETSPYLLQHAHNPVDWFPWGDEAFAKAAAENKPIFLSVGYSACHWCHVMERESFESPEIAAIMNAHFVNIKVDREERPDVDQIYMSAVQAMTGSGGWPMSVFLTPAGRPFFGGTYYPPADSRGMPGFPRVLLSVSKAWEERRSEIERSAGEMVAQLDAATRIPASTGSLHEDLLESAARGLVRSFDQTHGGFGPAPKFPHPMDLKVLLRQYRRRGDAQALHSARHTLEMMARGGIYDHLGGGFARYSTDERWLVPHFEKMLYDNALLAGVYLEAYQVAHDPDDARVARETIDYVLSRMTSPEGGFYTAEDADSEGVEGKYYVWSLDEVRQTLGTDRAGIFAAVFDVTEDGNWEGSSILNLPVSLNEAAARLGKDPQSLREELEEDREKLLSARDRRIPPGKDTKILTAWNGLMLATLAEAGRVLNEPRYLEAARRNAAFLLENLRGNDGRLLRSFKDGQAKFNGYLDDYACLIDGLTRLFEATGDERPVRAAVELADVMIAEFRDPSEGGFYYTGQSHEALIARQKDLFDNATPSGNGMAATALLRLAALTGRGEFAQVGSEALQSVHALLEKAPAAAGQSLIALDFLLSQTREIAVVAGDDPAEFDAALRSLASRFNPHQVVAPAPGPVSASLAALVPLLAERPPIDGRTATYICRHFTCQAPIVGLEALQEALVD